MFSKLLIANRGEIACRVIKTAKRLEIKTVAVFSEIDADALFVSLADEAYEIGPASPQSSYLNIPRIIEIALACNAEAIHPGYGFLSENANFANACQEAGITFIGPSAEVIASMGNKDQAKSIVEKAGIPTTPGYLGSDQSLKTFASEAKRIGYPVLLKAAAGGGGKGMRLVEKPEDLENAFSSAKRESKASFADDTLFIEKYLASSRHIEMQVFSDSHNNHVHLFDRDCSVQRRHQKIIEEAPAPNISDKTRKAMQIASIKILQSINYLGAGTIEYLLDADESFYFMEMNTRLQVEHPVTELTTGQDLVEWQIRVAAGEPLPLKQSEIKSSGHAIEARICAESPDEDFKPSIGKLSYLNFAEAETQLRIDTGVRQDDTISIHYDSMIAKVIVYAKQRDDAILQLSEALKDTQIVGVETNTEFVLRILRNQDFIREKINTRFIETHPELFNAPRLSDEAIILTCLFRCTQLKAQGQQLAHASDDTHSPWFNRDYWRLNNDAVKQMVLWHDSQKINAELHSDFVLVNKQRYDTELLWQDDHHISATINKKSFHIDIVAIEKQFHIFEQGIHFVIDFYDPNTRRSGDMESESHLSPPMPGNIVEILVREGDSVSKGDKLVTLEVMKMEHQILAPADGVIRAVHCSTGDTVVEGNPLIDFEKN